MEATGIQALAWGLLDGGVELATAYPGFCAHELAEWMGSVATFCINEKNAFAIAWGASIAGIRSATMFKNVGLNDAADPYVNACVLGVRAGMVVVVFDDIEVEQSQIQQDSRLYAGFPCSLWLEPRDVTDAYELARQGPTWSEYLECLVVLRVTNLLTRARGRISRQKIVKSVRQEWYRAPERWVVHPVYGRTQRQRLLQRQEKLADWVDTAYPPPPRFGATQTVYLAVGMAGSLVQQPIDLHLYTLPLPRSWLTALAEAAGSVQIFEHGMPYVANLVAQSVCKGCLTPHSVTPSIKCSYRITDHYEPLYSLLRSIPNRVIVGDLGGHTLDPQHTIDVCLCYGCSVGVATGLAMADPALRVFCITGDAAFCHSGLTALLEAIMRRIPMTVIVLDNGGSQGTGGQKLAGDPWILCEAAEYHNFNFYQLVQLAEPLMQLILQPPSALRVIRLRIAIE
ncbi:MAG: thiamine pyrophosphate-dependent enzyme [Thermogemmata sp.]|nr:thiamine pyrophosphate-dependent enzyme [Thermogemmata sp.]